MSALLGASQWQELFDDNVSNVWKNEAIPILKNISMIVYTLNREVKKIHDKLNNDVAQLRNICSNNQLQQNSESDKVKVSLPTTSTSTTSKESSLNDSDLIIISEDDKQSQENMSSFINSSPEIKRKRKYKRKTARKQTTKLDLGSASLTPSLIVNKLAVDEKLGYKKCTEINADNKGSLKTLPNTHIQNATPKNVSRTSDPDCSIIQCTPVAQLGVSKDKDKIGSFLLKKRRCKPKSTLTQMFFKANDGNSKSDTAMGLTRMVSYLNENNSTTECTNPTVLSDSTVNIRVEDNVSLNSGMLEDIENLGKEPLKEADVSMELNDFLAHAQNIPDRGEVGAVVRGKARQNLPSWACKDCEKFYRNQGLKPAEILALNQKCSRHRNMCKPREDTLPGYWDMDIHTQDTEKS